jgi:DNA-binding XRE family transcriptional regulator
MASRSLDEEVPPAPAWPSELRVARRSAGLTQGALGKLVHVSAATVGGYELGKWQPPADIRAALEGALEGYWPDPGQGGLNVSELQQESAPVETADVQEAERELRAAAEEALEEEALEEAVEEALEEEALEEAVEEALEEEALEEAVEEIVEEALEEAAEEALEDAIEEAVDEAEVEAEVAVQDAEIDAEQAEALAEVAELEALATLAEELRQRTLESGRRAGKATAIEAELLLGSGLAEVYRGAFAEALLESGK